MSTNLTIEKEKHRENEKVGDRPAKLNKENSDRELERDKKQRRHFLLEEKHENFLGAVRKWEMLAVIKTQLSGSEKKK